jgi:hypothetical protein
LPEFYYLQKVGVISYYPESTVVSPLVLHLLLGLLGFLLPGSAQFKLSL